MYPIMLVSHVLIYPLSTYIFFLLSFPLTHLLFISLISSSSYPLCFCLPAENKAVGVMKPGHTFTIEPMISEGGWSTIVQWGIHKHDSMSLVPRDFMLKVCT